MAFSGVWSAVGLASGGWLASAVEQTVESGPNLEGIAAIIAASAGMLSAVGALVIGLRSKGPSREEIERDIKERELMEKILKKLEGEDEQS